jgi:hypothetical protein
LKKIQAGTECREPAKKGILEESRLKPAAVRNKFHNLDISNTYGVNINLDAAKTTDDSIAFDPSLERDSENDKQIDSDKAHLKRKTVEAGDRSRKKKRKKKDEDEKEAQEFSTLDEEEQANISG